MVRVDFLPGSEGRNTPGDWYLTADGGRSMTFVDERARTHHLLNIDAVRERVREEKGLEVSVADLASDVRQDGRVRAAVRVSDHLRHRARRYTVRTRYWVMRVETQVEERVRYWDRPHGPRVRPALRIVLRVADRTCSCGATRASSRASARSRARSDQAAAAPRDRADRDHGARARAPHARHRDVPRAPRHARRAALRGAGGLPAGAAMRSGAATRPGARSGVARRFGHLLAGAALAWAAVGALATLFLAGWFGEEGQAPRWGDVAGPTALYVALWALVTPGLLLAAERVRFARPAGRPSHFVRGLAPNLLRAVALGAVVGGTAVALLLAYAGLATRWADGGAVLNLPEPALFFMGRFRENLLIGALLVAGRSWRGIAARCARRARGGSTAAQLGEARLQALSMELRPHFLFNTLNAISGMVWADPAKADAMVLQLAELLRRTLEAGESATSTLAGGAARARALPAIQQCASARGLR
jgi:hypothetical protein